MTREQQLSAWCAQQKGLEKINLITVSGDASFRRYFRFTLDDNSFIAVDAPPDKENNPPFVAIATSWFEQGIVVPEVLAADFEQGFMLLSDLGDRTVLPELNSDSADTLYQGAFRSLIKVQLSDEPEDYVLPPYDSTLLMTEMGLFRDWFCEVHLARKLSEQEKTLLQKSFDFLAHSALAQPTVPVHRDFHSRNLMIVEGVDEAALIDFQDAVKGPVTYDLVSLLRDCYIQWPQQRVNQWALDYAAIARDAGVLSECDDAQFLRWFDLMGLQRHLKAVGIFARLNHRDGKTAYLNDIPRTLGYVKNIAAQYPELSEFSLWINQLELPDGCTA
jgi:aminoglycoside/choline kinase family phosphotransferase